MNDFQPQESPTRPTRPTRRTLQVTPHLKIWVTQVTPGSSIIFATRYPPGVSC